MDNDFKEAIKTEPMTKEDKILYFKQIIFWYCSDLMGSSEKEFKEKLKNDKHLSENEIKALFHIADEIKYGSEFKSELLEMIENGEIVHFVSIMGKQVDKPGVRNLNPLIPKTRVLINLTKNELKKEQQRIAPTKRYDIGESENQEEK